MLYTIVGFNKMKDRSMTKTFESREAYEYSLDLLRTEVAYAHMSIDNESTYSDDRQVTTAVIIGQGFDEPCHLCERPTTHYIHIPPLNLTLPTCKYCQEFVNKEEDA